MKLVEDYLYDLRSIHYSDAGTDELTYCHPLLNLLNGVGRSLKPRVKTLDNLADAGTGSPSGA